MQIYLPSIATPFQNFLGFDNSDFLDKACTARANIFPVDEVVLTSDNEKMLYPRAVLEDILKLFEGILVRVNHNTLSDVSNENAVVGRIKNPAIIKKIQNREWVVVDFLIEKQSIVDFLKENPWGLSVGFGDMDIKSEKGVYKGEEYDCVVKHIGKVTELSVVHNPQIEGIKTMIFSQTENLLDNINCNLHITNKFIKPKMDITKNLTPEQEAELLNFVKMKFLNFSDDKKEEEEKHSDTKEDKEIVEDAKEYSDDAEEDKKEYSDEEDNKPISRAEFSELQKSVRELMGMMKNYSENAKNTNEQMSQIGQSMQQNFSKIEKTLSTVKEYAQKKEHRVYSKEASISTPNDVISKCFFHKTYGN